MNPSTSPASFASPRPIFGRIDSLRALGAMAVAANHFCGLSLHGFSIMGEQAWAGAGAWQEVVRKVSHILMPGHAAVMMFFVISGFVLRLALAHGPQTIREATSKFLIGRAFRIYPIVGFAVIVTALAAGWALQNPQNGSLTLPTLLSNMLLLECTVNNNYWALQVEILMIPVILALYFLECRRGPWVILALGVATSFLSFSMRWAIWPPLSNNVFAFVLGMAIPTLGRQFAVGCSRQGAGFWTAGSLAVLFLTQPCFGLYSRFSGFFEGYASFVLISMTAYRLDLSFLAVLDNKILRTAGLAAGSYYLLHTATFRPAMAVAAWLVPATWSEQAPALVGALVMGAWLIALVPLTVATYFLIEAPSIGLGRRLVKRCGLDGRPVEAKPVQKMAA